ncbi:MAG: ATP-binding protein, partial [Arthrobacter sp.]
VEGSPRPLTPDVDAAAYRIAQEALTNVAKYADPRLPVRVEVLWNATGVHINVANKGAMRPGTRGSTGSTGHGVPGMRERAWAVGGSLEAGQTHDGGYSVRATFPVPA